MEEIIQLTEDLIRFRTTHSRPDEILRCADFIESYLRAHEIAFRRVDRDQIPSIMVTRADGSVPILLMSHLDVVEGPDRLFTPSRRDGKLFGRGSIDDKYAVALSLVLVKEHLNHLKNESKGQDHLKCGLLITGDEEIGGKKGAREALKEIKADFCIALDGGNPEKIVVKEKGVLRLKLVSRGKAAHGARPWLGENAIDQLIDDYGKLKPYFLKSSPDHWHRTMNLSIIKAGKSVNQVPDHAEAIFDIRYTEEDPVEDLLNTMRREIRGDIEVMEVEPLFRGGDSPYLDGLLEIAEGTKLGFEHGASDARFLEEHAIKGIVWGAEGNQSQHGDDEHLDLQSLERLFHILGEFVSSTDP